MQTPVIANPVNLNAGPKSPARSADASGSDVSFNQMLTDQVAEQRAASQADNARQTNQSNKANESARSDNAGQANAANADKEAAATPPADAAKPDKTAKADDGKDVKNTKDAKGDKDDKAIAKDSDRAPPTATELIAMMLASPAKTDAKPDTGKAGEATAAQQALAAKPDVVAAGLGKGKDDAATQAAGKDRPGELADVLSGKAGKQQASLRADGDFSATVKQVGEQKQLLDHAAAEAQAKLTELKAANIDAAAPAVSPAQLQPAAVSPLQAAAGHPAEALMPRVGTPAWDQALGQKVVWMVGGAQQSASLTLNPPDLGPLQVVLNVTNGQADASFYAAQPEVRQALEAALPKLRDMMGDAGIQLGQASVSAGMPGQFNQPGGQAPQHASRGVSQNTAQNDTPAATVRTQILGSGQGMVDTFA